MSWDIVLFNSTQKINSVEEVEEEKLVEINFDKILLEYFTSNKQEDNYVEIIGENFSIDLFIDYELVSNKMISLYGENALFELAKLAIINNWQIYDSGIDKMLNLEKPDENGYANFQSYLNSIMSK
jgi:hypothetical protein